MTTAIEVCQMLENVIEQIRHNIFTDEVKDDMHMAIVIFDPKDPDATLIVTQADPNELIGAIQKAITSTDYVTSAPEDRAVKH